MILFVGGKAQGKQAAVRAKYKAECDVLLYPENMVRERLQSIRADQFQEIPSLVGEGIFFMGCRLKDTGFDPA